MPVEDVHEAEQGTNHLSVKAFPGTATRDVDISKRGTFFLLSATVAVQS